MKYLLIWICAVLGLICSPPTADGDTVFEDGFESSPVLGPKWSISATNDGRVAVSTDNQPATGAAHLVLDDSLSDAVFSAAEATITLDLSRKKNVVLSFQAKSVGNESHIPPTGNFAGTRAYDGVAVSADGGATWRVVQALDAVPTSWTAYSVTLDASVASLSGSFGPGFRIRFSAYDNGPAPIDGIAIDDVAVTGDEDQRVVVELPGPLVEGSGPHTGYVLLAFAPTAPLTVSLAGSPTGQLTLPATVQIPVGQTFATFEFSVLDDSLLNFKRTVTVTATAAGVASTPGTTAITDDEVVSATLTLPAQLAEGAVPTNNGAVGLSRVASTALTINLTAVPTGELTFPSTVTIPAGQTQVVFTVRAVDDTRIDGDLSVALTASAPGITPMTKTVVATDNETRVLSLTLPATVQEGGTATATVTLSGSLASPLDVTLTSDNVGTLTVPALVTVPAGQTQATFTLTAVDNTARDGSRIVNLNASATSFAAANRPVTVRDNEVAAFRFGSLPDIVNVSTSVPITVSAADIEGNAVAGYTGNANLSVVLPDGSVQPTTPASVPIAGAAGWTGSITLPTVAVAPLRLRASDSNGSVGESTPFDILRVLPMAANDLLWDAGRNRIYASIPANATSSNANKVVSIDPATLQVAASAAATNQDPGQLALTSGGEALYAALNGNGTIAKIDPATMSVSSTFPVGTEPFYGTLYAEDISTVAGQPNLLIVSQYRKSVSPRHNGVAVYDNGVRRTNKTQDHTGSNFIEPSADPGIFFGYNTETTEFGFRRIRLDASGLTQLEVNGTLMNGFSADMRSDGNKVFSTGGVAIDGALMKRLGTFGNSGLVRPDLSANRVFYLEPQSSFSDYHKLAAYDPTTFSLIRRLSLPAPVSSPASFIRWGPNGLAFRTVSAVYLVTSSQLVPGDAPADLVVSVQATPNPASVGAPLTYTVQIANQGPNIARSTLATVTLSAGQTIQSTTATTGIPVVSGSLITSPVGNLASGSTSTLTIVTSPLSAGSLTCSASANSTAIDPSFANNSSTKLVSVGFVSAPDSVSELRFTANSIIYDPARDVLWATIPSTVSAPLGKSVISINPRNGLVSDPIPINANPMDGSIALSGNGKYLYIGLSDVSEVHRIDLTSATFASTRVPLGLSQWGGANYAQDIEVLDGDGTSFIMAGAGDHGVAAYDGTVMRPNRSGIYTVDQIERTGTAGTFVGYNNYTSGYDTSRLQVTSAGVAVGSSLSSLITGYNVEISGSGDLLLASSGRLVNSSSLTLISNLGIPGRPCVDRLDQRAYLVNGTSLRAFDVSSGAAAGTFAIPTTATGDWAQACVRWGSDGFAILGSDKLYLARWSSSFPAGSDTNGNGIADPWETSYFGQLGVNSAADNDGDGIGNALEYFMGTSPLQADSNPIQARIGNLGSATVVHLLFPRRAGITRGVYGYEVSSDVKTWRVPSNVTESIVSTTTVGGVPIEMVDAAVPCENVSEGFVRLKWTGP